MEADPQKPRPALHLSACKEFETIASQSAYCYTAAMKSIAAMRRAAEVRPARELFRPRPVALRSGKKRVELAARQVLSFKQSKF
jgi:hypothetical protein